ncbi:uncharacterized protein METZ01_LOCUS438905, partial [marine metagenome]
DGKSLFHDGDFISGKRLNRIKKGI